jgi:hypothetical protein
MKLKVLEESIAPSPSGKSMVARISVRVNDDEILTAESHHSKAMLEGFNFPYEAVASTLRRQIMGAIEKRLFSDYNIRSF